MNDVPKRRFPFWLTLSVLGNLVMIGLIAGILLKGPYKAGSDKPPPRPGVELSDADKQVVRELMHESFEAGREAMDVRRNAERKLAEVLGAETYDEAEARAALAALRDADMAARSIVTDRMFEGLDDLSPEQRALVGKIMAGNIDRRGDRREKWKERREKRRDGERKDDRR